MEQRHKNHLSTLNDNTYFHRALKKYGVNQFKMELIEDNIPFNQLDEREKYWINEYDSFYTTGKGYNLTQGGQWGSGTQILTIKQADIIKKEILTTNISFVDLAKKYNVSRTCISDINIGRSFFEERLKYPLRTGREHSVLTDDKLNNIITLLQNTLLSFEDIAIKNNVKTMTIGLINNGLLSNSPKNYEYPLRHQEQKFTHMNILTKEDVKNICYKLCFSSDTLADIGKQYGVAKNTIGDISRGISWKEITHQFKCPIRKNKIENQKIYQSIYGIV